MNDIVTAEQTAARSKLVSVMATYRRSEDLINIGAYVAGTNPQIDYAIKKMPEINAFLRQGVAEKIGLAESLVRLRAIVG